MDLKFLLLIAPFIKGSDGCNIHVCLTWTVEKNYLNLRCKVNYLIYGVELFNNRRAEQGFCVHSKPFPKCYSSYNNTIIMQNSKTNITYLRVQGQIDSHFNGEWECKHGTNRDSATINVTVLDSGSTKGNDQRCWQSYLAYTMISFLCIIFLCMPLFLLCREKCKETKRNVLNTFCNGSSPFERCKQAKQCMMMVVLLVIVGLVLIPIIKGAKDDNICKDEEFYIIIGLIIAVLFLLLIACDAKESRGRTSSV